MDTTTPAPPPTPQPPVLPGPAAWWRRPVADLVDLVVVAVAAGLVGAVVAAIVYASSRDDLFGGLVAAFFGLVAAGGTAFVGWVALVLLVRAGRPTPGERCSGAVSNGRVLPMLGRHLAVLVALFAAAGAVASLAEPSPTGEMAAAAGAAVAAGLLVLAYGWGRPSSRVGIVVAALVVGGAVAGAVPDRPPHPWELRAAATDAIIAELGRAGDAERACPAMTAGMPLASHATDDCADPDRVWTVDRSPAATATFLAAVADAAVGDGAAVRVVAVAGAREVQVGEVPVAVVTLLPDCASRVVLDAYDSRRAIDAPGTCG